ncbi:hypothetical protein SteCoe_10941 [Stentor coeruleus]|uniref:Uncharacterized protein n=1 Tax=Stentor coeruleus TaxID=5963 RepID=A0A1R2CEH1_9CILI|nr:hypothetical protein SteCoe_10941 [Stentor coeruleus]
MGCCGSKQAASYETGSEIRRLEEEKSKLLMEQDSLKEAETLYSQSEEEVAFMCKRLTTSLINLQNEETRLESLASLASEITKRIQDLDEKIQQSESEYHMLQNVITNKKQELLEKTEELSHILHESSSFSIEFNRKTEEINELSLAASEVGHLEEKIQGLKEKINHLIEANNKVDRNSIEIQCLEDEIEDLKPKIEQQNSKHQILLSLDDEINYLQAQLKLSEMSSSEIKYFKDIQKTRNDLDDKVKGLDLRLEEINQFDIDELMKTKESLLVVKMTLKQDLKDQMPDGSKKVMKKNKLESRRSKLSVDLNRKTVSFDSIYEKVCMKLQKKQAEKISLEAQLKEFQDIIQEIEME